MSARRSVLLVGGTSDARAICDALAEAGVDAVVCTATGYGASLAALEAGDVRSGRLDAQGMAELGLGRLAIVDASHPFAVQASESARSAARTAGVPYIRFEREGAAEAAERAGAVVCEDAESAARAAVRAAGAEGTVLLTVGSRTVGIYAEACRAAGVRCVARVLPVPEALEACAEAGLAPSDVIAMQGPTSVELEAALLRHLEASVLVTKDSGEAGGVPQKLQAALAAGATAVVVARPTTREPGDEVGSTGGEAGSVGEVVERVVALAEGGDAGSARDPDPRAAPGAAADAAPGSEPTAGHLGLVHIYTGDGKGKTTAAVGLAVRAVGAGLRVAFVQFVKGGTPSSELEALRRIGIEVTRPASKSSGLMRNTITPEDREAARAAIEVARLSLAGDHDVVVLDELCVAARTGLVDVNEVVDLLGSRHPGVEVVMTGRGAPEALVDLADYVTEMRPLKHPFEQGIAARKGVEF